MIVHMYECNLCHCRYPLVPYYKASAGHGPDKDCRAPLGWKMVQENYPPTEPDPEHYPHQKARS